MRGDGRGHGLRGRCGVKTGLYISGAGHLAVVLMATLSAALQRPAQPPDVTIAEVQILSAEQFAALTSTPPDVAAVAAAPVAPQADAGGSPPAPAPENRPSEAPLTPPADPQSAGTPPDVSALAPPSAEAATQAPSLTAPADDASAQDVATLVAPRPRDADPGLPAPRPPSPQPPGIAPAPRVDSHPAPRPDPASRPDSETRRATAESSNAQDNAQAQDQSTAPEEAAPRIATEANQGASAGVDHMAEKAADQPAAPTRSVRPRARPATARAAAAPAVASPGTPPAAETQQDQAAAIAAAVAAAAAESGAEANGAGANGAGARRPPSGPPLTGAEKDGLRLAIERCWNVGSLSSEAMRTRVTVALSMTPEGKPIMNSLKMIGFEGGTEAAALKAYEAARRAIIRCGSRGYRLPPEKYEQWRDIEITFNPEQMRNR